MPRPPEAAAADPTKTNGNSPRGLVPGRRRRVGQQHGGVRRHRRARRRGRADPAGPVDEVEQRGDPGQPAREQPAGAPLRPPLRPAARTASGSRCRPTSARSRLATRSMLTNRAGRPRSCTSATKLPVIADRARRAGPRGAVWSARSASAPAASSDEPGGQPAQEEVRRDVGLPRGGLEHRAPVVGGERRVRHHRSPRGGPGRAARSALDRRSSTVPPPAKNDNAAPTSRAAAAPTAMCHISVRCAVVTTGSGGRPYTSGSSSSRKNAPAPPTPSSGSSPYSRASGTAVPCSVASRSAARSRSSSTSPNWMDSVGQACAQAGCLTVTEPVVAQRALLRDTNVLRAPSPIRRSMTPNGQAGTQ